MIFASGRIVTRTIQYVQSGAPSYQSEYRHMYLYQTMKGAHAIEFCQTKLNMDGSEFDLGTISRVEIFSANIADDGDDYCEIRVIDSHDTVLSVRRVSEF